MCVFVNILYISCHIRYIFVLIEILSFFLFERTFIDLSCKLLYLICDDLNFC